jgi:aminopeptidase N
MRSGFAMSVLVLLCLMEGEARQPPVQSFDQPAAGARSPRNASYDIDVRLDHPARTLTGRETIRWRNLASSPAAELQFHLYWNAWRDLESTFMRERQLAAGFKPPRDDAWGSVNVMKITVGGTDLSAQQRFVAPDDGNTADRTVMALPLPQPVQPNETIEINVEWTAKIPRPFARTGYVGDYYFIAQWFPKLGVFENRGWNTHQFHAATEFYSDYGVYDVRMTVPAGFVLGASGRQVERTANADGTETHRYSGQDIHDFAWTTSPDYIESVRMFEHPSLPAVQMRLLLQPEHAGQASHHFDATAAALKYYGEFYGPYPYDAITIIDPAYQSGAGGMEYPTLFTAGARWLAPPRVAVPQRVTIHEAGHQWWYGMVGSNEFEHAWMDEGLNTFSEARTMEAAAFPNYVGLRFFGGFVPWVIDDIQMVRATDLNRLTGYRDNAEADTPSTATYRYWPSTATFITYNKTALWLHTLERRFGWPLFQKVMSTYWERWRFRHPLPDDFFATVNEVTGEDMTWFFDQVYRSSNVFDYGIQEFRSTRHGDGFRTVVVARRFGEAIHPVDVVTTFRDGKTVTERWDGRDRRAIYTYDRPSQALSVQVDPARLLLLDVNYTNNSATLEPRAGAASLKWSLKWITWLQDLMLTYAFLV